MNKSETTQQLTIIAAAYPERFKVNEVAVNIWQEAFADVDVRAFSAAIKAHVFVNKWPPTIADINAEVRQPDYPTGLEAWGEVRKAIGKIGYYGTPTFTHPTIEFIVESLGWQTLCDMTNADATRAHFMKMYDAQCQRGAERVLRPAISGGPESVGEIMAGEK